MGKNFRSYLLDLRNSSTPFKGVRKALIDTLLDGYETARYGTGVSWMAIFFLQGTKGMPQTERSSLFLLFLQVFGQSEYLRYQEALSELATV